MKTQPSTAPLPFVPSRRSASLALAIVGWAVVTVAGMAMLGMYSARPGEASQAPQQWPADSTVASASERVTLVMAVHPRCPCSHSSVAELARLMRQASGRLDAVVLAYHPAGSKPRWSETGLVSAAAAIPGVRVKPDPDGDEARRLGMLTSGAVAVYDPSGQCLFSGGITGARGHEGDNAGRDAVLALLDDPARGVSPTPVFGCAIQTIPEDQP